MSNSKRFLISGVGASVPLLVNLTVLDLRTLYLGVTVFVLAGYAVRQLALFSIGGLVGLFNKEEDPLKLFQLGIAAPALISAMINANQVRVPNAAVSPAATASSSNSSIPFGGSVALAQELPKQELKTFSLPQGTISEEWSRGLFGSIPTNVWYVIAGSFLNKENAEKRALEVRQKGFPAEVYAPYSNSKVFTVVIGAQLTRSDATTLRTKAIRAGLPEVPYLWTFPTVGD
jgi:SPOR domain